MDPEPLIAELDYEPGATAALFEAVADVPWSMLLDSGAAGRVRGRHDIIVAEPVVTLVTRGPETVIDGPEGRRVSNADPFDLVREALGPHAEPPAEVPFAGGAMGYFAYDLARRLERLPAIAADGARGRS
jgi:para-aminobenzoate synthetase component 1